jgi:DNA-binding CsgD family transcriptional regulator
MTDPASGPDAPEFRTSGLTQAERRVLDEFHTGLSRRQIAARLGLSPNTVHAHLKSIFAKTGATRQADLARLGLLRASGPASGARPAGPAPRTRSITRRRMPAHATRPKRR